MFLQGAVFAQMQTHSPSKYFAPMITIGYSLGAGFSYGFDFTAGVTLNDEVDFPLNFAISSKFYFINLNGYANRVVSFNFLIENQYTRIGAGFGEIKRKWGYQNRNVNKTFGPTIDFGLHAGNNYLPWLGFKSVIPLIDSDWFERDYSINLYTYFRYNNINISEP